MTRKNVPWVAVLVVTLAVLVIISAAFAFHATDGGIWLISMAILELAEIFQLDLPAEAARLLRFAASNPPGGREFATKLSEVLFYVAISPLTIFTILYVALSLSESRDELRDAIGDAEETETFDREDG